MKPEVKPASFKFQDYTVSEFSFKEPIDGRQREIEVRFNPSGEYFAKDSKFIVSLGFSAYYYETEKEETEEGQPSEKETQLINATLKATFHFRGQIESLEDIPPYFYKNSVAIVFPYLRAFVTTLTAVANVKPLILPVLNLTSLEGVFKDNVRIIQE